MDIVVEVPRGSFIKRTPSGEVDFVAPLPSPFNYGSVPAVQAADGTAFLPLSLRPPLFIDTGLFNLSSHCSQSLAPCMWGVSCVL